VLLVIVHHVAGFQYPQLIAHGPGFARWVQYCGPLGVKVFFVISGFVICRLLIKEESAYGSVSLKGFYCRRIFRILPPFYLYLGAIALLLVFGLIQEQWKQVISAAAFFRDVELGSQTWFVGHAWSLAVEEQFYLLFPSIWILTRKEFRGRTFLGIFILCVLWNLSLAFIGWNSLVLTNTRTGFACIACGVLLAIYEARVRTIARATPAIVVAAVAAMLLLHPAGSENVGAAVYEGIVVPPAIGLLLLFSLDRGKWLRSFLCSRPVQAIGLTSYGIYLWQELFTAPKNLFFGGARIIPYLSPLLCVVVAGSYFLIEKPAMAYGRVLSKRARDGAVSVTAVADVSQF
jgi:peptidoglycan/LPS O-acetylase OafA/YrhL